MKSAKSHAGRCHWLIPPFVFGWNVLEEMCTHAPFALISGTLRLEIRSVTSTLFSVSSSTQSWQTLISNPSCRHSAPSSTSLSHETAWRTSCLRRWSTWRGLTWKSLRSVAENLHWEQVYIIIIITLIIIIINNNHYCYLKQIAFHVQGCRDCWAHHKIRWFPLTDKHWGIFSSVFCFLGILGTFKWQFQVFSPKIWEISFPTPLGNGNWDSHYIVFFWTSQI